MARIRLIRDRERDPRGAIWRDQSPEPAAAGGTGGGAPSPDSADAGSTPSGGGTPEGTGEAARDTAQRSRELTEHAQRRVTEVTGSVLGRARKAGIELGREAGLNDLVDLAATQREKLEAAQAELEQLRGKGKGDSGPAKGGDDKAWAEREAGLRESFKLQLAPKDRRIEQLEGDLVRERERTKSLLTDEELRRQAKAASLDEDGILDHIGNPRNGFRFDFEPPDRPGQPYRVIDLSDPNRSVAINPATGREYTVGEVMGEIAADPRLARLKRGKLAGAPTGGNDADPSTGANGGPARGQGASPNAQKGTPKTSIDLFESGLKKGELLKASGLG